MRARVVLGIAVCAACWAGALHLAQSSVHAPRGLARAAARPLVLPFLWRGLADSGSHGDAAESFADSRIVLAWLPEWTDGRVFFACQYALEGGEQELPEPQRTQHAVQRLAAAWTFLQAEKQLALDMAAKSAGPERWRAVARELLSGAAFLVELAARRDPALAAALAGPDSVLGGDAARVADRCLAEAEALGAGPALREQRLFAAPRLAASFLARGERRQAVELLELTLRRLDEVRDRDVATAWSNLLLPVVTYLKGERDALPPEVLADERVGVLLPFLR